MSSFLPELLDALRRGDLDAAAACFADDATYQESGKPPLHGKARIAEHFHHFAAQGRAWTFTVDDVVHDGERACVVFRFGFAGGDGKPAAERAGCATVRLGTGGLITEWREYQG